MNDADKRETDRGLGLQLSPERVRLLAVEAGFADAGLIALPFAEEARTGERFAAWIAEGKAGSMEYLARRDEQVRLLRESVGNPFPWARSAILCFASYNSALPRSIDTHADDAGWIARYAWSSRVDANGARHSSDYHKVLKKRLEKLEALLRAESEEKTFEARSFVDTGPVLERALAVAAGLGWTGKNTCLIHPKLGSFGFLAVLLTSLCVEENIVAEVVQAHPSDKNRNVARVGHPILPQKSGWATVLVPDRCGTCTRCIDACPTNALTAPRQMDATRCIAYLTIEKKGVLDESLMEGTGRQVFGCDICQDVCPWNRKAVIVADEELTPRKELVNPSLGELGSLTEPEFEKKFNGSPIRRAGYFGLLRNVAVAMGNSGDSRFRTQLNLWAETADEGLHAAAHWALRKLS